MGLHSIDLLIELVNDKSCLILLILPGPIEGCRARPRSPKSSLGEGDVADVDRYHQHIQYWAPVGAARIGATLARQAHTVCLGIFQHQLRGGEATGDIDAVVVAAKLDFLVKEEILNFAMRPDRARKIDTQHPPCLLPLLPGLSLLDADAIHCKGEGRREVGP